MNPLFLFYDPRKIQIVNIWVNVIKVTDSVVKIKRFWLYIFMCICVLYMYVHVYIYIVCIQNSKFLILDFYPLLIKNILESFKET